MAHFPPEPHRYWRIVVTKSSASKWEAYIRRIDLCPSAKSRENAARGGTAFAPTEQLSGDGVAHAFTDDLEKRHRTQFNPGHVRDWVMYDALKPIVVQRVVMWQFQGGEQNHILEFQLQYADDPAKEWKLAMQTRSIDLHKECYDSEDDAAKTSDGPLQFGPKEVEATVPEPICTTPHRFWRIVVTQSSASQWEAYFHRIDLCPSVASRANPARGGAALSPTDQPLGDGAEQAFTADLKRRHRTQGDPGGVNDWVLYDALEPITVQRIVVWQLPGGLQNHVLEFQLQYADDLEGEWHLAMITGEIDLESCAEYDSGTDQKKILSEKSLSEKAVLPHMDPIRLKRLVPGRTARPLTMCLPVAAALALCDTELLVACCKAFRLAFFSSGTEVLAERT